MATKAEVYEVLIYLGALYPAFARRQTAEGWSQMAAAYGTVLVDIPGSLLGRAAISAGASGAFFPSASELRKAALEIRDLAENIPSANDAWAEVSRKTRTGLWAADERGFYNRRSSKTEDWTHPLIQKAVEGIGGWSVLRQSDNLAADRARFLQAYSAYRERYARDRDMLPAIRDAVDAVRRLSSGPDPISLAKIGDEIATKSLPPVFSEAM
jgi:hypothetical protein